MKVNKMINALDVIDWWLFAGITILLDRYVKYPNIFIHEGESTKIFENIKMTDLKHKRRADGQKMVKENYLDKRMERILMLLDMDENEKDNNKIKNWIGNISQLEYFRKI